MIVRMSTKTLKWTKMEKTSRTVTVNHQMKTETKSVKIDCLMDQNLI